MLNIVDHRKAVKHNENTHLSKLTRGCFIDFLCQQTNPAAFPKLPASALVYSNTTEYLDKHLA